VEKSTKSHSSGNVQFAKTVLNFRTRWYTIVA